MTLHMEIYQPTTTKDLMNGVEFMSRYGERYRAYRSWLGKVEQELLEGTKEMFLARSAGHVIADVVIQYHKQMGPAFTEIKNLRVLPPYRNRGLASFLLKQAEVETQSKGLICDVKVDDKETVAFLLSLGFIPLGAKDLYADRTDDLVLIKPLESRLREHLITQARQLIF